MTSRVRDIPGASNVRAQVANAPRVLVTTTRRWLTITRLALELSECGFSVYALCPAGHSLARASFVSRACRYNALRPLRSLHRAIEACQPDFLIPTDEDSVAHLHRLYITTEPTNVTAEKLRSLIERSLGDPEQFPIIHARAKIASLARALGVNSPISYVVCNVADLEHKLEIVGFPAVLKTDASMGGRGVAIVQNLAEAKRAFRKFSVSPSVLRTLKRLVINLDANLVMPCLLQRRARISIQAFVCGKLANAAVACWKGEVLAHVTVEVLATQYANGPATVVNVITHSEISEAVALVTRQLNLSGLCGFDFILDPIDGRAHMIELNPRATQTCHLVSSEGKRLLASLAAQLQQPAAAGRLGIPIWGPIVLFPYAMAEEQNVYPKDVFKDVPWQSPQLVSLARGHPVRQLLLTKFRMQSVLAIFRQFSKS